MNSYYADLTIKFYDRYNWDKGKAVSVPIPHAYAALSWLVGTDGPIRTNPYDKNELIVEDEALARLHLQGLAREYDLKGEMRIIATWKAGDEKLEYQIPATRKAGDEKPNCQPQTR